MVEANDFSIRLCRQWSADGKRAFHDGFYSIKPYAIPIMTWGLVAGLAMSQSVLSVGQAVAMSLFVYAGSAQLASLQLISNGASILTILLTALIVNVRLVVYSAAIQAHFKNMPFRHRLLFGFLVGDLSFVAFLRKYPTVSEDPIRVHFYLGVGVGTWLYWQISSIAGVFLGGVIPNSSSLRFAGVLTLVAVVIPMLDCGRAISTAVIAGIVSTVSVGLPYKLNVFLAVVAAILFDMLLSDSVGNK